ncbi:MAG: endo-1,4-beta-xylanase [Hyphomicrobium sp.]|nr:endo-1,4-beta-xylanase [Hyphomicrobium sp.]
MSDPHRMIPAPSRRAILKGAAATLAAAPLGTLPVLHAATAPSLSSLAAARGLRFGASFSTAELDRPYGDDYARIYERDAAVLTAELELKMLILRPAADTLDFSGADRLMAFARENGKTVRGHTLIWNDNLPDWISRLGPGEIAYLLEAHIETVIDRYPDIPSWDVVNEPIAPWDRLPGNLRKGAFLSAMGEDYIAKSFEVARRIAPKADLVLNEAQTESADENGQVFRESFMALLKRLHDRGTPIDTIGLQCHIDTQRPYDFPRFAAYLAEIANMGYGIAITELDVNDRALPADIAARDKAVAGIYRDFLSAVLPVDAVRSLTLWQLADHTSWLYYDDVSENPNAARRPRPLPYDARFEKKRAWHEIAEALQAMPPRTLPVAQAD